MMLYLVLVFSFYGELDYDIHYVEDAYSDGYKTTFWGKKIGTGHEGQDYLLRQDAADSYQELVARAEADGFHWEINSAYRSSSEQRRMLRQRRRWAAPLGLSSHQAGVAVDLSNTSVRCGKKHRKRCRSETYRWLSRVGPELGWANTAPKEPWHWVYVGTTTSEALRGKLVGYRPLFMRPPDCRH